MTENAAGSHFHESRRKKIFRALVLAEDYGLPVAQARALIQDCFELTEEQLQRIESEGIENDWLPP